MYNILTHILYLSALGSFVYGQGLVWEPAPDLNVPRHEVAATLGKDGRIYAIGGWEGPGNLLKSVEAFDESSQTWIPNALPDLLELRSSARAVTDSKGRIWVIGGSSGPTTITDTVAVYNPSNPDAGWQIQTAKLKTPRCYMGAVIDRSDTIYIFGGGDGIGTLGTAEKYDPQTGQWTSIASMHQPKYGMGYSIDDQGRIYAIGGSNGIVDFATAERYDPATDTWERLQKSGSYEVLDYPHASCACFLLGGKIWVVGGWNNGMLNDTTVYDPSIDTWQRDSNQYPYLYEGRVGAGSVVSKTGWVYIVGGQNYEGTATSHVGRMLTALPADCTKVLYEADFSVDPGWITDQPENFYWDPAIQAYRFRGSNTQPEPYTPKNRYYGTELRLGNSSFIIEWDLYLTRLDWSAGFTFGLFDETRQMFGGQNIWADFAFVDRGLITTLYVFGAEGSNGASTPGGIVELNRRYSCRITYDAPSKQVGYELRLRRTSELVWSASVSIPGGFTNPLQFLGGTREGVRPPYTGVNPSAVSEGMIDNVKVTILDDSKPVLPRGGEQWLAGTTQTIEWPACRFQAASIRLDYSPDLGESLYPIGIVSNTGKYRWVVPSVNSDQCRIFVSRVNGYSQMISEETFTIFVCQRVMAGDLNHDCYVTLEDLALFSETWMLCGNPFEDRCNIPAD